MATRFDDNGKPLPPKSRKPITRQQKAMQDKAKAAKIEKVYTRLRADGVWI